MIVLKVNNEIFYDDALVLVKMFYPRHEVLMYGKENKSGEEEEFTIEPWIPETEGKEKKQYHEEFKSRLYEDLVKKTGQNLPWGYLTGVRPSKIAYQMLDEGAEDSEILDEFVKKHKASTDKANLALNVAKHERKLLTAKDYSSGYSLYIGIPFCPTTCLYCSFTSYSILGYKNQVDDYLTALIKEMRATYEIMKGQRLDTIYFGGGTPTTLESAQLDRLLTALEETFARDGLEGIELTVEAGRPDSITREKLEVLRNHQVQRISINPQTMNQKTLDLIGRHHTVEQIKESFYTARELGFENINMDIILGLPDEGVKEVTKTLDDIRQMAPESLTMHSLAIKRAAGLNIWRDRFKNLSLENDDATVKLCEKTAADLGLEPYYMYRQKNMTGNFENVGYAKPGFECMYNILIMEEIQTIVALGAGAATKRVWNDGRIERATNVKDVKMYLAETDEMIRRKQELFQM